MTSALAFPGVEPRAITVTGIGLATLPPDRAVIQFVVSALEPSARKASAKLAATMESVRRALRERDGAQLDPHTTNYSVRPDLRHRPDGSETQGYRASQTITVTSDTPAKAGDIIDDCLAAGGNEVTVQNVAFHARDASAGRAAAQRAAVADARQQAETLAEAAGLTLGPVLRMQQLSGGPGIFRARRAASAERERGPATVLGSTDLEVVITLEVAFSVTVAVPPAAAPREL